MSKVYFEDVEGKGYYENGYRFLTEPSQEWISGYQNTSLLKILKEEKIKSLSEQCQSSIFLGFLSSAYQNTEKHYDCEMTDQARVNGLCSIAQLRIMGMTEESISWKATGELECYSFEPTEMLQLGLDLKRHIESKTEQFYQLRKQVLNAQTTEEVNSIQWF